MAPLPENHMEEAVSDSVESKAIRTGLWQMAWRYGKVALLIDDQADAASRVARELYAADALPEWWWVARSMRCATQALGAFLEIFDSGFAEIRGLAVIDRYLPVTCDARDRRPFAWDQAPDDSREDSTFRQELARMIKPLLENGGSEPSARKPARLYELMFVTSYPYARKRQIGNREEADTEELVEATIPWKTRSIELFSQYRREISGRKGDWKRLLRYGPEPDAPVVSRQPEDGLLADELNTARWKATVWKSCLKALADQMHQRIVDDGSSSRPPLPIILFTGAGASLAQGTYGAGIPETWKLLEKACYESDRKKNPQVEQDERWPPVVAISCVCEGREILFDKVKEPWEKTEKDSTPVEWLLNKFRESSIRDLDWRLEQLFDIDLHQDKLDDFRKFHRDFRDALYRCDHGCSYQHWLMARMPWSAILTTNFDGFHERSAVSAAQISWLKDETRSRCLQLGSIAPDWPSHSRDHFAGKLLETTGRLLDESLREEIEPVLKKLKNKPEERGHSLFKIYGSLYSPSGEIALSLQEIKGFQNRLYAALKEVIAGADGGALVVIGHSMRDQFIHDALQKPEIMEKLKGMQILWVDPVAFDQCSKASDTNPWEDHLKERKLALEEQIQKDRRKTEEKRGGNPSVYSGPLPATALEFLQDLWLLLQKE